MRTSAILCALALAASSVVFAPAYAGASHKGALNDTTDLFASVTPDRLLGSTTRRQWLDLYPVDAKVYWAAWDCKGQPCDTRERAHIRATAKLVSRTERDPKPMENTGQSSVH